jgi:NADH:ubiquinone oxidoreductase subunit 4 (subunit M)
VAVLLTGGDRNAQAARVIALIGALIGFAVTIPLYTGFNLQQGGFQFIEMRTWIDTLNANYHLGIDGISLLLILLNSLTTVLVVAAGLQFYIYLPHLYRVQLRLLLEPGLILLAHLRLLLLGHLVPLITVALVELVQAVT